MLARLEGICRTNTTALPCSLVEIIKPQFLMQFIARGAVIGLLLLVPRYIALVQFYLKTVR